MRIREMKCKGFSCWPLAWASRDARLGEGGVLRDVRAIQGTKRIRLDVEYEGKVFSWIISASQHAFTPLYQVLRTNIGKSLLAIGDLEIRIC